MIKGSKQSILIIDDEEDILDFLSYNLRKEHYLVFTANNGIEGVRVAKEIKPDIIILDVMMPGMDGIEVCQTLRNEAGLKNTIIAFLTARSEDYTQIAGLEVGADDYMVKPIRPRLLISKIQSLLRRTSNSDITEKIDRKIYIDPERFIVKLNDGTKLTLPKKEFELLELLASRPGKVFKREQILSTIWGNDTIVGERTIDVHVRKLREKIGNTYIRTVKGVGYTFDIN